MRSSTFIIGFMLCGKVSFSQLGVSNIDSLNSKMLHQRYPINLSNLGSARMNLKDGSVLFNCTITEVKNSWIVYKKRGTLHDQSTEKIKEIIFDEQPFKLEFDNTGKGKLILIKP